MNSLLKMNQWLETSRSMWAFAVFSYRTFIAPWPPFTVFMAASALVAVVTPTVIVRATSGLIDAITRAAVTSPGEASLIELLEPVLPWLALLLTVRAADSVIQMDAPFLFLARKLGLHSMARLEDLLYGKAVSLKLEWFEYPRNYDGLQRVMEHRGPMDEMDQSWHLLKMQNVIVIAFQTAGILVALAAVHWSVPVAMLAVSAVLLLSHGVQVRRSVDVDRSQTMARRRQEYWRKLLTERSPAPEVRLFGLATHLIGSWRSTTDAMLREKTALRVKNLSLVIPSSLATVVLFGVVLFSLVWAANAGVMTAGAIVAYVYITWTYVGRVSDLHWQVHSLQGFVVKLSYLLEFFGLGQTERQGGESAPTSIREGVELRNVSFTYPGGTASVLSSINMEIRPGETVALVGENGAGKTTLTKILLGLYQPTGGVVTVDGTDLREVDLASWRDRTGAVFQDYMTYAFTARENIGIGRIGQLDNTEAIRDAAVRSGANAAIEDLPQGYETLLGREFEGGRDLSRGQWQSLAIARLYLRDAELLVLDEPTSALDALAEVEVYRQFLELSNNKSVLLISHRLGSARLADRVVFLKDGKIVEQGTHDELVEVGGAYAELFTMQAEWYR